VKTCSKCGEAKPLDAFYSHRKTKDGKASWCKACVKVGAKLYYETNSDLYVARALAWKQANPEKHQQGSREWKARNRDRMREYALQYRAERPEIREAACRRSLAWQRANPAIMQERRAAHRAGLARATPAWVDREALLRIYAERPEGYHVDHIVPLRSKHVCGLHVPWNLQYLPAVVNIRKSNKLIEENEHGKAA
jgi:hypothetical protein